VLAATHNVTGTVVDDAGKPVAKAQVSLLQEAKVQGPQHIKPGGSPTGDGSFGTPEANKLQKDPGEVGAGEQVVRAATTDATGKFTLLNVSAGDYKLQAVFGKKSVRGAVKVAADADPAPVTLKLPK